MRRSAGLCIALACALASGGSQAATTVIYRCTDAAGAVTFQNGTACPPGTQQQRRVIDIPAAMPAFRPPPRTDTPPAVPLISTHVVPERDAATTAQAGDGAIEPTGERTPPPPLFACKVYDQSVYYREDDTPPARCRPLQTVGIGNLPGMGAGQACETVADVCTAVPEDALCRLWDTRVREAEFRWQYAQGRERDALRLDYETLYTAYAGSTCPR